MQQRLVFCDEFGNTGGRVCDPHQRVLVYAYVLADPGSITQLIDDVQEIYRKDGVELCELKSAQLIRSLRGRRRYAAIGEILSGSGTSVFLSVVEKRYQACSMIAETFLDPVLHDFAPPEMRLPHFRQKFTDACYDTLNDARITEVVDTIDADNAEDIASLGRRLSATLQLHPDNFVSHAANCMETRAEAVFRYGQIREGLPKNAHLPASQYMGFYPGLQCVERYLAHIDASALLIRDEDAQYGEALTAAVERGMELDQYQDGGDYGAIQLSHIAGSRSASSAQEIGIQMADLAAGLFGRVAQSLVVGDQTSPELASLAALWRGCFVPGASHYMMVSDARLPKVREGIFREERP